MQMMCYRTVHLTILENGLTVTRGERGGDNGGKGWRVCRNNYKGHMDNYKGCWKQGREVGRTGMVGRGGGRRQKTVLEQQ